MDYEKRKLDLSIRYLINKGDANVLHQLYEMLKIASLSYLIKHGRPLSKYLFTPETEPIFITIDKLKEYITYIKEIDEYDSYFGYEYLGKSYKTNKLTIDELEELLQVEMSVLDDAYQKRYWKVYCPTPASIRLWSIKLDMSMIQIADTYNASDEMLKFIKFNLEYCWKDFKKRFC